MLFQGSSLSNDPLCSSHSSGSLTGSALNGSYWQRPTVVTTTTSSDSNSDNFFMSGVVNGFSYSPGTLETINNSLSQSTNSSNESALGLSSLSNSLGSSSIGSLAMQSFASNQLLPQLQLSPSLSNNSSNGNGTNSTNAANSSIDSLASRRAITGAHNFSLSANNSNNTNLSSGCNKSYANSGNNSNMFKPINAYNWSMANNTSGGLLSAQSIPITGSGSSGGSAQSAGSPQSPISGWNSGSPTSPLQLSQQSSLSSGWGSSFGQMSAASKFAQPQNQFGRQNGSLVAPISPLKKNSSSSGSSMFPSGLQSANSNSIGNHLAPQMNQQFVHPLNQQLVGQSTQQQQQQQLAHQAQQQLLISPKYRGMSRSGMGNGMPNNSLAGSSSTSPASNVMLMMGMGLAAQQAAVGNKLFDLGSVGSTESATCSSGDSNGGSLRDNHNLLLNFQNNLGLSQMPNGVNAGGPLDNMRYPLEQHLLEIMRSTSNEHQPDNHYKGNFLFNF